MTPEEFVKTYLPSARAVELKKGFHRLIMMTAAAQEGSWGNDVVGNNFFGVKDNDGVNGNEILVTTTEYSKSGNLKFPVILKKLFTGKLFKYTIKDYFRKYDTAEQSFMDYCLFFENNPRYATALKYKMDPDRFFEEISKAGYATDPNYADNLKAVLKSVIKRLPK